jgi:hypothetical protein
MKTDSLNFSLIGNSIPAAAPERKTQMRRVALHILRGGMIAIPHGEEARSAVSNHEATTGPASFETPLRGSSG